MTKIDLEVDDSTGATELLLVGPQNHLGLIQLSYQLAEMQVWILWHSGCTHESVSHAY